MTNLQGDKNPAYKKINKNQLKELILNGYKTIKIMSIMKISRNIITLRAKEIKMYNILKENNKNIGKNNGNYIVIPIKKMNIMIEKIMNNNLFSNKQIKQYTNHLCAFKSNLINLGRYDVLEKLKQNNKNFIKNIHLGKNNSNYTNGITQKIREQEQRILLKQNYKCKLCNGNTENKKLHKHHIDLNHLNNVDENIVYLCSTHHNHIHQRGYNFWNEKWSIDVCEVFFSLQGEGLNAGFPTLFWRNTGCNMLCKYCDTKYSWKKSKQYSYNDVITELKKYNNIKNKHLCITGGESFIQNIEPLILLAKIYDFYVEVETNGTIIPQLFKRKNKDVHLINNINISFKLSKCGAKERQRLNTKSINFFNSLNNVNYKFVIEDEDDINETLDIIKKYKLNKNKIRLMPMTTYNQQNDLKIRQYVWNLCLKYNFIYCPRLHYEVWGKKRGV